MKHQELTEGIMGAFYRVCTVLGYRFLEKVYVNALMVELHKLELEATARLPIYVYYGNRSANTMRTSQFAIFWG